MGKRNRMRNKILKGITWMAGIMMMIGSMALDSESIIPIVVVSICLAWLGLMVIANK